MSGTDDQGDHSSIIGNLALKHSLVTEADLNRALQACAGAKDPDKALVDYLVSKKLVSAIDAARLSKASIAIKMRQKTLKLGVIAIEKGFVSKQQLKTALDEQKRQLKTGKRPMLLGDILVVAGFITPKQRDELLEEQTRLKKMAGFGPADLNGVGSGHRQQASGGSLLESRSKEQYPLLGRLALKHSLVEEGDLKRAVDACGGAGDPDKALADYLGEHKLAAPLDVSRLVKASRTIKMRQRDIKFGALALSKGLVTEKLLQIALDEQKKSFSKKKRSKLIGDILVEAGIISPGQRDTILEEQNRLKEMGRRAVDTEDLDGLDTSVNDKPSENADMLNSEMVMGGMLLRVAKDRYSAYLTKTEVFNENITVGDIKEILDKKQIVSGIADDDLIEDFITSRGFKKKPFRIAKGIEPVPGKDAVVNYFFDADRLKAGKIDRWGAIDFKERGDIPQVDKDRVLAEKIPAVEAIEGLTIFADAVKMPPARDVRLKPDKGAKFDTSGLKIVAAMEGQPVLSLAGVVSVFDEFETRGDVSFETGHVDYKGNINVKGCVRNDFRVTGNIVKANEIDGGIVNAEGDVIVTGGINGARIYSKGSVSAKFILKSEILCMGDVVATQEIIDSKIHNSGACIVKSGSIIASEIVSFMGVYSKSIGTDRSRPSSITSGRDIFVTKTLALLTEKIADRKGRIEKTGEKVAAFKEKKASEFQKSLELTAVREKALEQKQRVAVKIDGLDREKNAGEIKSLEVVSVSLEKSIHNRDNGLEDCKRLLLDLDKKIPRLQSGIECQKEALENLLAEKETLTLWMNNNPGIVLIEVAGTLKAGTRVAGKHTAMLIQKTVNGAAIKEFCESDNENSVGNWKLQVISK